MSTMPKSGGHSSKRILIVEDDIQTATNLKSDLLALGYEVPDIIVAGEDTVPRAKELRPDLILMDIAFVRLENGIEAAREITQSLGIPIVYLTAHNDTDTGTDSTHATPFGYLPKLCDVSTMINTIELALYKYQIDSKLRESEERYRLLFDKNPDPVFAVDETGRFVTVNPACEVISGYSLAELLTMTFRDVCTPDTLDATIRYFEMILRKQARLELETAVARKDGARVEVWVAAEPMVTKDGSTLVHCTAKDITERKIVDRARQFLTRCGSSPNEDFFQELARHLSSLLEVDFVCIDRLSADTLTATTEAVYFDGAFEDNISYTLHDTPCGTVAEKKSTCCFPAGVRRLFPHDEVLQQMEAEGYLGTTMMDSHGKPIGLIALISRHPLKNPGLAQTILELTSARAAGELERKRTEESLRESEAFLRQANEELEFRVNHRTLELQRSNRALQLLSASNEAVIRINDHLKLIQEICRITVEIGGYLMAWAGLAENDADKSVRPVAYSGLGTEYLQSIRLSWGENDYGRGPAGTAIRTGAVQINRDFQDNPEMALGTDEAVREKLRSSIALPLFQGEKVIGVLAIYSSEPNDFNGEQLKGLQELALNLSIGLTSIQMKNSLRLGRDRLRTLAGELTMTERRERHRLANVLHNDLQQLLVAAGLRLHRLLACHQDHPELREGIEQIDALITQAVTATRSLATDLRPPILTSDNLAKSLGWLTDWLWKRFDFTLTLSIPDQFHLPATIPDADIAFLFDSARELCFNIVKHAHVKEGRLTLQLTPESQLCLSIADDGLGAAIEASGQLNSADGGLGLQEIRDRLALIGGELRIRSERGRGFRVDILLPIPSATASENTETPGGGAYPSTFKPQPVVKNAGHGRIRVMLVDDHAVVRDGLKTILQDEEDIEVIAEANNGRQAWELARQLKPDIIIMDVNMPEMDGIDATRLIKQDIPHLNIIALSINDDPEIRKAMEQAGACAYLNKSGSTEDVCRLIRACSPGR